MIKKIMALAIFVGMCCFSANSVDAATNTAKQPIPKVTVKEYIVKHSMEMGIDPALALSIAKLESGYRHEIKSPYGAVGVFQLLPATAKKMGYNAYYLSDNIKGGLKYYQMMYKKFGSVELALAAYNVGPDTVARYKGMPPYKETKYFVNRIMTDYNYMKKNPDPIISKVKNAQKSKNILKPQVQETPKIELVQIKNEGAQSTPEVAQQKPEATQSKAEGNKTVEDVLSMTKKQTDKVE